MTSVEASPVCEGMLLYPVVREPFAFDYRIGGFRFQVRSIDLAQPWRRIHEDMVGLLV